MPETTTGTRARWGYVAAAAALAGLAAGGWWLLGGGRPPTATEAEVRPAAEAFLADLRTGKVDRIDAAWAGTTADFKSFHGRDDFRKYVRARPALKAAAEFAGFRMADVNGVRVAECAFASAAGPAVKVRLAPAESAWKVDHLAVE
jgi:hypothetical protein